MMTRPSRQPLRLTYWVSLIMQGGVKLWQLTLGPLLGPRCRFYPSCSQYASECLTLYPLAKAIKKSTMRIMRCHPFNPGGVDLP